MLSTPEAPRKAATVVVLSDTAFIDGGGAAVGLRSAIALARAGLRVRVVSAVGPPMRDLENEPNLSVRCGDQRLLVESPLAALRHGVWNERSAALLEDVLRDCDPDSTVVHVHGWTKALSASIFAVAAKLGFRVVVTLHDFFAICPTGSLYLHRAKTICTLDPMGLRCITTDCDSRHYTVKAYRVVRQLVQQRAGMPGTIDAFISVSRFSRSIIEPHLPTNATIYPVRNPIDREPAPRAAPERFSRFLYLGRLSPEKGPELFARAARDAGVPADFAGEGTCAKEIESLNPAAGLLGWLDARQVIEELERSRALVFPSLWYETYGLSVMEAAASGVPAIVPHSSAASELVEHGATGFVFESGNVASLAAALRDLARPGVAERLGAAAYDRFWSDPPTMDKHVAGLLDVYASVLRGR